jgi:predicted regulator of Ras-like GTPase activity (Roadblock/LC7/MglB family)
MPGADRQQILQAVLRELTANEAISLAVLASDDGFLVAAVPEVESASVAAAIGASLHQLADRLPEKSSVDEVSIVFDDGQRLVCRALPCEGADMLLSVVVRPGCACRRLTNRAMREICAAWTAG